MIKSHKQTYMNFATLLACTICAGLYSVYLGIDLSWDLANYHYYNPYSLLHNRNAIDFWPQSFPHANLSPTGDLLSYYLINSLTPIAAMFISGALHGICFWLSYLIAYHFLVKSMHPTNAMVTSFFLTILGAYNALGILSIGDFRNDFPPNIFVLGAILLQVHVLHSYGTNKSIQYLILSLSGFLLGIAIGIKLTTVPFFIGCLLGLSLIPIPLKKRFHILCLISLTATIGLLISSGYWMLHLWDKFHNPFYPFLNSIFHSPFYNNEDTTLAQFTPPTFLQALLFPIKFSLYGVAFGDGKFTDLRYAIVYILLIIYSLKYIWLKLKSKPRHELPLDECWLFLFTIFSLIIWEYLLSGVRYLTPITLLSPLIIFLLVTRLIQQTTLRCLTLILLYSLITFTLTPPLPLIRWMKYDTSYFNVFIPKEIKNKSNALVLIAYPAYAMTNRPKPQSYLIPFFPASWRFAGIPFKTETKTILTLKDKHTILTLIEKQKDGIFLLASDSSMLALYKTARSLGLVKAGECQKISSNRQMISGSDTLLCPVIKTHTHS